MVIASAVSPRNPASVRPARAALRDGCSGNSSSVKRTSGRRDPTAILDRRSDGLCPGERRCLVGVTLLHQGEDAVDRQDRHPPTGVTDEASPPPQAVRAVPRCSWGRFSPDDQTSTVRRLRNPHDGFGCDGHRQSLPHVHDAGRHIVTSEDPPATRRPPTLVEACRTDRLRNEPRRVPGGSSRWN